MAKYTNDLILDNGLEYLDDHANLLVLCEDQPASYANATTDKGSGGMALGEIVIDAADMAIADGDVSGRKITVAQQTSVGVDVSGVCDYIALVDTVGEDLLLVTPMANAAVTAVNQGTDVFTIDGDHTTEIEADDTVTVRDSTGNDGAYTVASVVINGTDTDVEVDEEVPSAVADGVMIYGAQTVTNGNTATINAFDLEIADPT